MTVANVHDIHYLKDVRWEYPDRLTLGYKSYISAEVQQNLFNVANITLEGPYRLNQKTWRPPLLAYKKFRKMTRNYAKRHTGLFTRIVAKITTLTRIQHVNFVSNREIGHIKAML